MSQLQNKLQWSENQLNESKKAQDDLQDKLNSATEELKAQKEKLNEALASRSEADKNLEDAKEKLAELQVCLLLWHISTARDLELNQDQWVRHRHQDPLLCHVPVVFPIQVLQGGHGTGKTGNLVLTFSRQGKHREFCFDTGKKFETQGKYFSVTRKNLDTGKIFDCDYSNKKCVYFFKFNLQIFIKIYYTYCPNCPHFKKLVCMLLCILMLKLQR